ncbi:MAG TPA: hypothetical protein VKT28_04960 [Puia sp.]|nr:hypothetical protein [Puia sp.]
MKKLSKAYRIALLIAALFTIASCTKTGSSKKNSTGTWQCAIEGDQNKNFNVEGGCDKVFATYSPGTTNGSEYNIVSLQATDNNGQRVALSLAYKGDFPTTRLPEFTLGGDNSDNFFGTGQFFPDANDAFTVYSSNPDFTGKCTITAYDAVNQRLAGTFSFSAQLLKNNAFVSGAVVTVNGSFDNVPIIDLTDPNNPKGPCNGTTGTGLGGNTGGGGNGSLSTITFTNPAFTPIDITFNGETKQAPLGGSAVFSGTPGANATGSATTSGKTSSGTQVGLNVSWTLNENFPSAKGTNVNVPLNVDGTLFFLKIQNKANVPINKVFVNYGLVDQTEDDVTINNNSVVYSLGYYKAFTNSNVRGENGTLFWSWNTLGLSFTNNQSTTLTANP